MTDATAKPELYPQYCFRLSPTINRWCHFRISDILALRSHRGFEGQDVYFHLNHPIKWVRICGIVVAVDERATKHFYTIDDGSGATLECVVNLAPGAAKPPPLGKPATITTAPTLPPSLDAPVDVGHLLDIKGSVGTFRDNRQVRAEKVAHLSSAEPEVVFWEKAARLKREVLARPWVLDRREVRRCRKEEEHGGRYRHERRGSGEHGGKRRTGLEKVGMGNAALKTTGVVKTYAERRESRKTGLERSGPAKTASRTRGLDTTRPEKTEPRATGLERTEPRRTESRAKGLDGTRPKETDLESLRSSNPRSKATGLERTRPTWTELRRTGLERVASRQPGLKKTGLEKAKATGLEKSASPGRDGIRKPLAERQARMTGLEKRSVATLATRPVPILGKYDALGL